jgi:RHS repeat-associated protein
VREFIYDAGERLAVVRDNDLIVARYQYDPMGRRIRKESLHGITWFQYSDEGLIAEYAENGTLQKAYGWKPFGLWGSDPVWMAVINASAWDINSYHVDQLRTPQRLTDSTGAIRWNVRNESFGEAVVTMEAVDNPLGLPGQYHDSETGTNYNLFRSYVAVNGRYNESDPVGLDGGVNVYAYANQNPLKYIDPLGLDFIPDIPPDSFIPPGPAWPMPTQWTPPNQPPGYGCGDAKTDRYIPDAYVGFDFSKPCRNHDICYGTCGSSKDACDSKFYRDMSSVCGSMSKVYFQYGKTCRFAALAYYNAVHLFGEEAFCTAQKEACPKCKRIPGCG